MIYPKAKNLFETFFRLFLLTIISTQISCAETLSRNESSEKLSTPPETQTSKIPPDWQKISVCKISFSAPKDLKNENLQGIDSCIASFKSDQMQITLDYGWYGGAAKKDATKADFKEEAIEIDGRKAKLATFKNLESKTKLKFFANLYVVVVEPNNENPMTTSLLMGIRVENEKDLATAKRVFQTIRFDK